MLLIALGIIFLDQATKIYVKGFYLPLLDLRIPGMYPGESIPVLGDFFKITFTENPGMAFGFDPGSNFKLWISLFSLFAGIGLVIYLYVIRQKSFSLRIAIALILGGAVGNLIDRMFYGIIFDYAPLFYGRVVDFFDFDFFNFTILGRSYERWPIFNIADAAVSIGVLILMFFYRQSKDVEEVNNAAVQELAVSAGSSNLKTSGLAPGNSGTVNKIDEFTNEQTDKGKEFSV